MSQRPRAERQFAMQRGSEFIELMMQARACALALFPVTLSRYEFDFDLAPERFRGAVQCGKCN